MSERRFSVEPAKMPDWVPLLGIVFGVVTVVWVVAGGVFGSDSAASTGDTGTEFVITETDTDGATVLSVPTGDPDDTAGVPGPLVETAERAAAAVVLGNPLPVEVTGRFLPVDSVGGAESVSDVSVVSATETTVTVDVTVEFADAEPADARLRVSFVDGVVDRIEYR